MEGLARHGDGVAMARRGILQAIRRGQDGLGLAGMAGCGEAGRGRVRILQAIGRGTVGWGPAGRGVGRARNFASNRAWLGAEGVVRQGLLRHGEDFWGRNMKTVPISELVEDFSIYPRFSVDQQHVTHLADVLLAGKKLPPILVDKKSKRIVDGIHRKRAYQRAFGDNARVPVLERVFASEKEMVKEAARANAAHGRRMTSIDFVRVILRCEELEIPTEEIAEILQLTVERVNELKLDRTARAEPGSMYVPIKRTIGHMHGKDLTQQQVVANGHLGGMNQAFYVNQLITLIESDLLDKENEQLQERLRKLFELLEAMFATA
jgi:hypothetical protein